MVHTYWYILTYIVIYNYVIQYKKRNNPKQRKQEYQNQIFISIILGI